MVRNSAILQEDFEEILAWLNSDRDVAGTMYLELRAALEKIFEWHHCADPQGLTDEVFDRVTRKIRKVRATFEGDPRRFFHGVARNLIKESSLKARSQVPLEDIEHPATDVTEYSHLTQVREDCLQACLEQLDQEKRDLIVAYYAGSKQAKIDHRAEMARDYAVSVETLRVRAYRIRMSLEACIRQCLKVKEQLM